MECELHLHQHLVDRFGRAKFFVQAAVDLQDSVDSDVEPLSYRHLDGLPDGATPTQWHNPYIGFGLAYVESTIRYGFRAIDPSDSEFFSSVTHLSTKSAVASSSGFVTMQRIGLAASGEEYGFSLEFLFIGSGGFIKNPFQGGAISGIDSSTYDQLVSAYNNTGSTTQSSAGMRGAMMRASVLYTFF